MTIEEALQQAKERLAYAERCRWDTTDRRWCVEVLESLLANGGCKTEWLGRVSEQPTTDATASERAGNDNH